MFVYEKGNSVVHRMGPLIKMILMIMLTALSLLTSNLLLLGLLFLLIVIITKSIGLPVRPNAGVFLMFLFAGLIQYFLIQRFEIIFRFAIMLYSAQLFSLTTAPSQFALSLERIGLPFAVTFVISTAFRFIPILEEEFERIKEAQLSRGLNLKTKNPIKRIRNFFPLGIPLLRSTLKRSEDLAMSLESRGFGARDTCGFSLHSLPSKEAD